MKDALHKLFTRAAAARQELRGELAEVPSALARPLQLDLALRWRERAEAGKPPLSFEEVGFDVFSATWEDGILLYIFSLIGMRTRRCVDIGAGAVRGSNVANLLLNHGFSGLLIDGDARSLEVARHFYSERPETKLFPPATWSGFVDVENVNLVLEEHGLTGEIDLFCLDIDGIDYWILKALRGVDPRVVVVEYQDILGPDRAWTVPYRPDFNVHAFEQNREHRNYCGASLRAFVKLGREKGYRLVGCNRGGWNAFFVKNGVGDDRLPEVSVESCFRFDWNRFGMETRFPLVQDMEWEEV